MPIYRLLEDSNEFPPVEDAEEGISAVGGDLSPERLISAYTSGIFPWFSKEEPIVWWAPDPRFILYPKNLKVSKSMKQLLRRKEFDVTFDTEFEAVINNCALQNRPDQDGTWLTDDMINAYTELHALGLAHSVEVWNGSELVGGLYGVSVGAVFFGESMFFKESNASKYGFIQLVDFLIKNEFQLIDCQMETKHLKSLGGEMISRVEFMNHLNKGLQKATLQGTWGI